MPTTSTPRTPEGRLIRQAREDAGLSIPAAAARGGMSASQWGNLERGWRNDAAKTEVEASEQKLAAMARAAGVTPEQLERAGRGDAATRMRESPAAAAVPEAAAGLPPEPEDDAAWALFPGEPRAIRDIWRMASYTEEQRTGMIREMRAVHRAAGGARTETG